MSTIINADTSGGLKLESDLTGTLELQSAGTTIATVSSTGIAMASGKTVSGDISYAARAWVNFNGTGVIAIRASGNVSSITDNSTGYYTVNLTTVMPDTNCAVIASNGDSTPNTDRANNISGGMVTTSSFYISSYAASPNDSEVVNVAVFR